MLTLSHCKSANYSLMFPFFFVPAFPLDCIITDIARSFNCFFLILSDNAVSYKTRKAAGDFVLSMPHALPP